MITGEGKQRGFAWHNGRLGMRNEIKAMLNEMAGDWTTDREEIADIIKEYVDCSEIEYDAYEIYDDHGTFGIWIEVDDKEFEFIVEVENVGNTWYIAEVR